MSNLENFKKSLEYLAHHNSNLANRVLQADATQFVKDFAFTNTKKNELNLNYKKKFSPYNLHSEEGAVSESMDWFGSSELNSEVVYVFGIGLGYSFFTFRNWLKKYPTLKIIFIEPHLPVLFHLFQTHLGLQIVEHPRVYLYHFQSKFELCKLIDHLSIEFAHTKAQVLALPIYLSKCPSTIRFFSSNILRLHDNISTTIEEAEDAREDSFRNIILTAQNLKGRYRASQFKNLFKNIPCIIVGAGPSLNKNFELLKELKEKAIILAGSSAVSSLTQRGFEPHLGNFFDPYERVMDRFKSNTAFEMPTFHSARTYFQVNRQIHGPALYIKGSDATPFVKWLEDELGFDGELIKELVSVTASNTLMALLMGCDPIIYVGVDLAYTSDQTYSEGIVRDTKPISNHLKKDSFEFEFNREMSWVDIEGNPTKTRQGWKMESDILGELAMQNPQVRFFNCTEGGIGMPTVSNIPLKQATDWFLKKNYPIEELIYSQILPFRNTDEKVNLKGTKLLKELLKSLSRCSKLYQKSIREIKELHRKNKNNNLPHFEIDFIRKNMALISHEIGYQYLMKRYQQFVDIPKLKNRFLERNLSIDAPIELLNEIKIVDMISRFRDYKVICDRFCVLLRYSLKQIKDHPWQ